ncbi:DUF6508 domain-containing protein [Companilactobacillus mishanensis]|uniref:Uncharacterized protein n=1 Tax=Companilactobacillus mishanensis TaxID=2486008 RepID=A0ABW9P5V9_9LACO|nr:DUF6508 domain-containing protein [Companilactobacillus mishanensis]MQS44575.1 hypothetical protein [Companilactobacillus mishanensis]
MAISDQKYNDLTKFVGQLSPQVDLDNRRMLKLVRGSQDKFEEISPGAFRFAFRIFLIQYPGEQQILQPIERCLQADNSQLVSYSKETELVRLLKRLKDIDWKNADVKIDKISFSAGGFGPVPDKITLDFADKLMIRENDYLHEDRDVVIPMSDGIAYSKLAVLQQLHLEYWDTNYFSEITNGEQWQVSIHYSDGTKQEIWGSNAYPLGFDKFRELFEEIDFDTVKPKPALKKIVSYDSNKFYDIIKYIPTIEERTSGKWLNEKGLGRHPYYQYEDIIFDFITDVNEFVENNTEINIRDYQEILLISGIEVDIQSFENVDVSKAAEDIVLCLIYAQIKQERLVEGSLSVSLRNGVMLDWLKRLEELGK